MLLEKVVTNSAWAAEDEETAAVPTSLQLDGMNTDGDDDDYVKDGNEIMIMTV